MHSFKDFAKDEHAALDGEKIKIAEIINAEVEVHGFRVFDSKISGKKCLQVQIIYNGVTRVFFTNSEVLLKQMQKYEDKLPFTATVKRVGSYYTFS